MDQTLRSCTNPREYPSRILYFRDGSIKTYHAFLEESLKLAV